MPKTLKIAVCICQGVTFADFMLPMELLGGLNFADHPALGKFLGDDVPYRVQVEYLAPTMDLMTGFANVLPGIKPTKTYTEVLENGAKYDVIWVPAGTPPDFEPFQDKTPPEEIEFLKKVSPNAKYIMSVCGGSSILALAGILNGKRATTNKLLYKFITNMYGRDGNVTWVPQARWVVDGNVWTSSGVTAGTDMAIGFLETLVGPKITEQILAMVEIVRRNGAGDDPFAAMHGLI